MELVKKGRLTLKPVAQWSHGPKRYPDNRTAGKYPSVECTAHNVRQTPGV